MGTRFLDSSTRIVPARIVPVAMAAVTALMVVGPALADGGKGTLPLKTTTEDFFQPGTQPDPTGIELEEFKLSTNCATCHGYYLPQPGPEDEPFDAWVATMMAQAARDPIWRAAVEVANQDAAGSGETCIRCHAPLAWLGGRSEGGELDDLTPEDLDGVTCHVCHRMVNPVLDSNSPPEDGPILDDLLFPFTQPGNGRFVIDPVDSRRGPFDDVPINMHGPAAIIHSPFHQESELCASCHDVSTTTLSLQPDGTYALNDLGEPHPTQDPNDMFPEQRTYSEWKSSQFAAGGVLFEDGRFGGNHPTGVMESCQDCHMPDTFTGGCFAWEEPPFFARPDMPRHSFSGANTWVLNAVLDEYGFESGLNAELVNAALDRNVQMLRDASDLELTQTDDLLNVRVTNWSGHKLPTGYPEGRRIWINVQFFDANESLIGEHGAYDAGTAELSGEDTKVYQAEMGLDAAMAAETGLPEGPAFHLALNNKIFLDNRIPPVGFTNAAFEAVGAAPVAYTYADGQHWDDTEYEIPECTVEAVVTVYYQTTSKEYAEFLLETAGDAGQNAYDHWVTQGRSAPVDMDCVVIAIAPAVSGDVNGDGVVSVQDLIDVITSWGMCDDIPCLGDSNCDGVVNVQDLINVIVDWG